MKIETDNSGCMVAVNSLQPGECFKSDGELYLRTDMDSKSIIAEGVKSLRGISLRKGELVVFPGDYYVYKVNAKVVYTE